MDNCFQKITPTGIAGKYIRSIWYSNIHETQPIHESYLPKLSIFAGLVLNGNAKISYCDEDTYLSPDFTINGFYKNRKAELEFSPYFESMGIEFTAIGAAAFFKMPLIEFQDRSLDLSLVLRHNTQNLIEQLCHIPEPTLKIYTLLDYITNHLELDSTNDKFINHILKTIHLSPRNIRIRDLANDCACTEKTLKRRFENLIGTTPKNYVKLLRFNRTIYQLAQENYQSLDEISYNMGYFDVSHMVRDFRSITTNTPVNLFKNRSHTANIIWGQ